MFKSYDNKSRMTLDLSLDHESGLLSDLSALES